jgi:hypothetical protein
MHADMLPTSDFYIVHGSHQVKACEAQNLPRPRRGRLPGRPRLPDCHREGLLRGTKLLYAAAKPSCLPEMQTSIT